MKNLYSLSRILVFLMALVIGVTAFAADNQCASCHEDVVKKFSETHHSKAFAGSDRSCASCHGGTEAHMKEPSKANIITFLTKDVKKKGELSAQCLTCHKDSSHVAMWDMGVHKKNGVSCNDCHKIHVPSQMRKPTSETCLTCHKEVKSQISKLSHHPILEGKVGCADCHNPHGNLNKHQINATSTNQLCYKCHQDKRGPFLWEHAPVEENCLTCHNVHGSSNNSLLSQKPPQLCQSCHSQDSGSHFGQPFGNETRVINGSATTARFLARGCMNCHNKIHGSNAASRGRRFIR